MNIALSPTRHFLLLLATMIFGLLLPLLGVTQEQTSSAMRPFTTAQQDWEQQLLMYEHSGWITSIDDERRVRVLEKIRTEAKSYQQDARENIQYFDALLAALGSPPEEGALPEPVRVKQERDKLQGERDDYVTREKLASVVIARISMLTSSSVENQQNQHLRKLWEYRPSVLWPKNWSSLNLQSSLGGEDIWSFWRSAFWVMIEIFVFAALYYFVHRRLIVYFSEQEAKTVEQHIPYWYVLSLRLFNFIINTVTLLAIWSMTIWVIKALSLPVNYTDIADTPFFQLLLGDVATNESQMLNLFLYVMLVYITLRAILAPRNPIWGALVLNVANARLLTFQMPLLLLAALFMTQMYDSVLTFGWNETQSSFFITVLLLGYAYFCYRERQIFLTNLIDKEEPKEPEESDEPEATISVVEQSHASQWFILFLRRGSMFVTIAMVVLALLGYQRYALRIAVAMPMTAFVLILMMAVRKVIAQLIKEMGDMLRSDAPEQTKVFGVSGDDSSGGGAEVVSNLLMLVVNVVLAVVVMVVAAIIWGYPIEQLNSWINRILQGVEIGNNTISLKTISIGLGILFSGFAVAGFLKTIIVRSQVLSKTASEGVRYSIGTILQYISIVIAFLMTISYMGLDLRNLGFFAGALGIGIGFGLQNIVQNFVSGLILLIQRPMEVGDWVEIDTNGGIVKRVNLMNTEIQTFQHSTIILPNSDVMSATFINRTRGNRQGRVDIEIGVSYDADPKVVEHLLLEVAKAHPMVMKYQPINVFFMGYGNSSLDFELRFFTYDILNGLSLASEMRYLVFAALNQAEIEIPFPQRVVHFAKTSTTESAHESDMPVEPAKSAAAWLDEHGDAAQANPDG